MKILLINSVCGILSTGRIVADIAEKYIKEGNECIIAYGRESVPEKYKKISYRISSNENVMLNGIKARIFDNEGFNAEYETKKFIEFAEKYNPDLLWLHNLHGYYINVEMLFDWIKSRPEMEIRWTLHDCWAFTGHCPHFSYVNCTQWKTHCEKCVQKNKYPISIWIDRCKRNYEKKKKLFCGVKKMTLIVPSNWLNELVKQSFLKDYPCEIIPNSIDRSVFKVTDSDFRKQYGLENKKIILGVASAWSSRKGLYHFFDLSNMLDDSYKIVLVGMTKKQIKIAPENIICIERTNSKEELAQIYSAADVFVNPSSEESFGLTTIEALACGTFPIVFKNTACEEVVNQNGGIAVEQNVQALYDAILDAVNRN